MPIIYINIAIEFHAVIREIFNTEFLTFANCIPLST